MTSIDTTRTDVAASDADRALKHKHRTMWALGDYPAVVSQLISSLGPVVVEASGVGSGTRVLDVAAGTGNVAIPAARTGAHVVASDLTPELLAEGERLAKDAGVQVEWQVADVEALPNATNTFDAVLSCVGVMFAPHHQVAADEVIRVCRSGGTITNLSWTPDGFIGQLFATMKPYVPAPPPGVQPPPLWGSEAHVAELFADRVSDVRAQRATVRIDQFAQAEEVRDFFKGCYGPTIVAYRNIADEPARVAELDAAFVDLVRRFDSGSEGHVVLDWEYLLYTATKR